MVTKQYSTLGFKLDFQVPETVDEFNKNAWKAETGEGNPCLAEGINNIIYRGSLAEFRDWFLHGREEKKDDKGVVIETAIAGVEQTSEIPRLTEEVKDKAGKVRMKDGNPVLKYTESEEKYFDRVIATLVKDGKFASEDLARASFEAHAKEVAAQVLFDAAAKERSSTGPKRLPAKYKLTAARLIANDKVATANSQYLAKIGKTFTATNDTTKMFEGTYEVKAADGTVTTKTVSVSDKDAEALGWLLKEYNDWQASQTLDGMNNG